MEIEAKFSYSKAKQLMATGIYIKGLKESIEEWETLAAFLKNSAETLSPLGKLCKNCPKEHLSETLVKIEGLLDPVLHRNSVNKYFFGEDRNGEKSLLTLYEDLLSAKIKARMILDYILGDNLPFVPEELYQEFISTKIENFCDKIREDFTLAD